MAPNPWGEMALRLALAADTIVTIAVILRLLSQKIIQASIEIDDWLILFSLVPAYSMTIVGAFLIRLGGAGRHTASLDESQLSILLKLLMVLMVIYTITITTVKISILLMYRRIFSTPSFKMATSLIGGGCVIWFAIAISTDIFSCHPVSAFWNIKLLATDHCFNLQHWYFGVTVANMLLDIVILCLPIYMIHRLKLPTRQKFMVSGIFLLGSLTCVASVLRLEMVQVLKIQDIAYTLPTVFLWSCLEPCTAILSACVITYRPLFMILQTKFTTRSTDTMRDGKSTENADTSWSESQDSQANSSRNNKHGSMQSLCGRVVNKNQSTGRIPLNPEAKTGDLRIANNALGSPDSIDTIEQGNYFPKIEKERKSQV